MHAKHADFIGLNELSGRGIGCAFTVLNTLGARVLEKVYENALAYEIRAAGQSAVQQYGAKVHYKDILVGQYFVDLLIDDVLLVELKTVKALDDGTRPRARVPGVECNAPTLKATGLQLCLLFILQAAPGDQTRGAMACEPRTVICLTPAIPVPSDHNTTPAMFARGVNFLDICALAVPNGFTAIGLPTSLQIIGRDYAEPLVLRIGYAYQSARDWHLRVPPMAE